MRLNKLLLISLLTIFTACSSNNEQNKNNSTAKSAVKTEDTQIKYAQGFSVKKINNYRLVDIHDPLNPNSLSYHYALVPRGTTHKNIPSNYTIIETPIRRVICMTTLQTSNFIKLKQINKIVGISSTRFLFNEQLKEQLQNKSTSRIGIEGNFDSELILALNPDIILVSPFKKGGYDAIKNLGFPLVTFLGYKESSPLGQAEWIKFIAMLLDIEDEANETFDKIEEKYHKLKALTTDVSHRPTVMSGELHAGNWYVVGGKSYLANLFKDAGANYFLKDNEESGGFYVDFETVYAKGAKTDFWRIMNSYDGRFDYDILRLKDGRYADFDAYKKKNVIYCNLREKPFYENTPVEPEVVLADFIKAFHPELLPDYQPVYYEILTDSK